MEWLGGVLGGVGEKASLFVRKVSPRYQTISAFFSSSTIVFNGIESNFPRIFLA